MYKAVRAEHFQNLHGLETLIIHVQLVLPQWEIAQGLWGVLPDIHSKNLLR